MRRLFALGLRAAASAAAGRTVTAAVHFGACLGVGVFDVLPHLGEPFLAPAVDDDAALDGGLHGRLQDSADRRCHDRAKDDDPYGNRQTTTETILKQIVQTHLVPPSLSFARAPR